MIIVKVYGQQSKQCTYLEKLCSIINELCTEQHSPSHPLFFHASCTHFLFFSLCSASSSKTGVLNLGYAYNQGYIRGILVVRDRFLKVHFIVFFGEVSTSSH